MSKIHFFKYQGTGNDFILIDNRDFSFDSANVDLIESLCHRRFGIGADGLMLLEPSETTSFTMRYYNSDGRESTMCGNGGRCIAAFASNLGVVQRGEFFTFEAVDGTHEAVVDGEMVSLKMVDVSGFQEKKNGIFIDTGSPHFIKFVDDPDLEDVFNEGKYWRNHSDFSPGGTNVNFVGKPVNGEIKMRTFERGVENETWSCGTGAVASAIASFIIERKSKSFVMKVPGGKLTVSFDSTEAGGFKNVWLKGPVKYVFNGLIESLE
ncbi:MAG: diaminopimelate epimerase [Bacteroidota bacterium]